MNNTNTIYTGPPVSLQSLGNLTEEIQLKKKLKNDLNNFNKFQLYMFLIFLSLFIFFAFIAVTLAGGFFIQEEELCNVIRYGIINVSIIYSLIKTISLIYIIRFFFDIPEEFFIGYESETYELLKKYICITIFNNIIFLGMYTSVLIHQNFVVAFSGSCVVLFSHTYYAITSLIYVKILPLYVIDKKDKTFWNIHIIFEFLLAGLLIFAVLTTSKIFQNENNVC